MMESTANTGRILAEYRLSCPPAEAEDLARRIAYEQTVELPESLVTDALIREQVAGRVESVFQAGQAMSARISYNPELCSRQLSQLLILLFGNVSIYPGVRLVSMQLPEGLLSAFRGPAFGIAGVREMLGVYGRPLLATAIKPRGLPLTQMSAMAAAFARGGGDIIKDDQNLADVLPVFKERVAACFEAVAEANAKTGGNCLYFPHISAPADQLETRFQYVQGLGVRGVLLCPMVYGLDSICSLANRYGLVVMAHPALTGGFTGNHTQGIDHGLLLGTLFRLAGADISIFPSFGGRFSYTPDECQGIRDRLQEPLGNIRSALPAPAGGMQYDNLPELCRFYGAESVFLVGGALQAQGPDLETATRAFRDQLLEYFPERLRPPAGALVSACELPDSSASPLRGLLQYLEGFHWQERRETAYKPDDALPFHAVKRVELMGQHGEQTAFDLRYFEIGPGGYTSLERHRHTHVVIGIRGIGRLIAGERRETLGYLDIAYIGPMEVHQIRNEAEEPFGFFCIVDHRRDQPLAP